MIRRPPRSTLDRSSAASDVYKRQEVEGGVVPVFVPVVGEPDHVVAVVVNLGGVEEPVLSLIHISEPPRPY
mgnify:CR=1 FL=1